MSGRELELLAPAGRMEVLKTVINAGADAVYLGGKRFNMRMLKPGFNFSDVEIAQAVEYLHRKNKKIYVTVNNLYKDNELDEIDKYLLFLQEIGVDALIVQDPGIIEIYRDLALKVPLHASVQMGIANLEAVNFLQELGFKRVILSKNLSLEEIKEIHQNSTMNIEFFAHGDLCVSHAGQCYMSSFIFSESGNQGKCLKPCRWNYRLDGRVKEEFSGFQCFLAHKDLCLYPHLAELINAGVSSFKIEGRMRESDYLSKLLSIYRRALDSLMEEPSKYEIDEYEYKDLQEQRIRDFSSGNIYGKVDLEAIGLSGEREPRFFSKAAKLSVLNESVYHEVDIQSELLIPELSVKISDLYCFKSLYRSGIDNIIIGFEQLQQNKWTNKDIYTALKLAEETSVKVFLETPRIVSQNDLNKIYTFLETENIRYFNGVIVNDLGTMNLCIKKGILTRAGYGLNILNNASASFLHESGIDRVTASLEIDYKGLKSMLKSDVHVELLVHGPLEGMICDLSMEEVFDYSELSSEDRKIPELYALIDAHEQKYKIRTDMSDRLHIYYPHDRCLFPFLPELCKMGIKFFRIDGQYYDISLLKEIIETYKAASTGLKKGIWRQRDNYLHILDLYPDGLSTVPLIV